MCYSLESSIRTSILSAVAIIYLYTSNIPKYKWLAITLLGWCIMQFAEMLLWLTKPNTSCTMANKIITLTLIPFILILQGLGALFGSFYVTPWRKLTKNYKLFFIFYTIIIIVSMLFSQFGNIESTCTTVTPEGHLNWSTRTTEDQFILTNTQSIIYSVIMIGIPLTVLWKNKQELIIIFAVPLLGALYSLTTDSPGSIWCYYTSFSSIVFALMLFLHNHKIIYI